MKESPFATPVERFLVENQHVRRLCIGFRSKRSIFHEKVTVCDICRALLGPVFMKKSAFATPVQRFLGFHEEVTVCDACRALLDLVFMKKSPFATPVERFLVENQHVRRLCIGFWSKRSKCHEKVTVCDTCRALFGPKSACSMPVHRMFTENEQFS